MGQAGIFLASGGECYCAGRCYGESGREFGAKLKEALEDRFSGVADRKGFYLYDEDGNITGANDYWTENFDQ